MSGRWLAAAAAAALTVAPGCRLFRKDSAKAAPPVLTSPPVSRAPAPEQPTVPPPPKVAEGPKPGVSPPPQISQTPSPPAPPPKPEPPKQKKARRRTPPAVATAPPPQPAAAEQPPPAQAESAAPVPQLTQLLSPAEQAAYNRAIDAAVERTRANLAKVQAHEMDANQKANLARARAFLQQAEDARATDLPTAKSLADRADILAQDLARSLK